MLFDTDVLIWVFRGSKAAARLIDGADDRSISVITYMELLQGARGKQELRSIKEFLVDFAFQMLPLTENIGHRAAIYMEEYALKGGLRVADALIAATAVEYGLVLSTANRKHYSPVRDLEIKPLRP
jgi:predicted nucleic acid-binding protein